jgi:hypothetical protein
MAEEGSSAKKWWAGLSPEAKEEWRQNLRVAMKRYWASKTPEERKAIGRNVSKGKKEAARVKKS